MRQMKPCDHTLALKVPCYGLQLEDRHIPEVKKTRSANLTLQTRNYLFILIFRL
jgi:hypothetical protein